MSNGTRAIGRSMVTMFMAGVRRWRISPRKAVSSTNRNAPEPYVSNFKVMQEEMSQRDVMTANRDKTVWAVAQGQGLTGGRFQSADGDKVKSNHPGPKEDKIVSVSGRRGSHQENEGASGDESESVRQRGAIPGTGQTGADGVGHQGTALGGGVAELSGAHARQQDRATAC